MQIAEYRYVFLFKCQNWLMK